MGSLVTGHYQLLLNEREAGVPFTSGWLRAKGLTPALASYYERNGLSQRLGRGFYCPPKVTIEVSGLLSSIQSAIPGFHVASYSALACCGINHNPYADHKPSFGDQNHERYPNG